MASTVERGGALLARFAEFYEEVARIREAIVDGSLAIYLSDGKPIDSPSARDLAALVSRRLLARLREQSKQVDAIGTQAEVASYRVAQYAVAALADELFVIEFDWPGREPWQSCLLEQSLFGSGTAGRDFFLRLDKLLGSRAVSPLEEELAAVFLMCLRLGFKGQWRGESHRRYIDNYRARLINFIGSAAADHHAGFQQAYQYRITGANDERMAPLSRWYRFAGIFAIVYLLISSAVWVMLTNRLTRVFSG